MDTQDKENLFLNSLTPTEYVLFVETRKNQEKWGKTGTDVSREATIRYEEELMTEQAESDGQGGDEFSLSEIRD
jgi:hypothetical protein